MSANEVYNGGVSIEDTSIAAVTGPPAPEYEVYDGGVAIDDVTVTVARKSTQITLEIRPL